MRFPRFVNLGFLETTLQSEFVSSLREGTTSFDLSEVEWISPLSVVTLGSWLASMSERGRRGAIILPRTQTDGTSILFTRQFNQLAHKLGFETSEHLPTTYSDRLFCFEHFDSSDSLESYLAHLDNPVVQRELLNTTHPPQVVSTGDFHRVAVRELVRNALTHSGSPFALLCAVETTARRPERLPHPVFSNFGGSPYVELAVADFGPRNIEINLRALAKSAKLQPFRAYNKQKLDSRELTLVYAFAFSSTSRPDLRREQIARLVGSDELDPQLIATGLFDVACVASSFGGQILIRSAARFLTLDFSDSPLSSVGPRVSSWRPQRKGVQALPGSIITIRIPHAGHQLTTRRPEGDQRAFSFTSTSRRSFISLSAPALDKWEVDTLLDIEDKITAALRVNNPEGSVLAIFVDFSTTESKWNSALLQIVARLPRLGWCLMLLADSIGYLQLAAATWERYSQTTRLEALRRPPGFLILGPDGNHLVWGDPMHAEATGISPQGIMTIGGHDVIEKSLAIHEALTAWMAAILQDKEVRYAGRYSGHRWFLVEGRYYVSRYYAVNRLLHVTRWRRAAERWLASAIAEIGPRAIISLKTWLFDIVKEAKGWGAKSWSDAEQRGLVGSMVDIGAGEPGRVVLLTDLVCTARDISLILERSPLPGSEFFLVALVDGRAEELEYLAVNREDGPLTARVVSALKDRIPRRDSHPPMKEVWVVDPSTGLPVPPDPTAPTRINPLEALARFGAAGAIVSGHISDGRRHYLYFLNLQIALDSLAREIEAWLLGQGRVLVASPQAASGVRLMVPEEPRRLLEQVEAVARELGIRALEVISLDELRRGVRLPARRGGVLWSVLPITASGETCWRALHAGARVKASRVHVSAIFARSATPTLALFAGLTEYRGVPAAIKHLVHLPLASFAPFDCPSCARRASYSALYREIRPRYPELAEAVRDAQLQFELRDRAVVEAAGGDELSLASLAAKEARCQALVALGERSADSRRQLERTLSEPDGVRALLRFLARGMTPGSESRRDFERILYDTKVYSDAVARFLEAEASTGKVGHLEIQGAVSLWPEAIRSSLAALSSAAHDRPEVGRALAAVTALDTEQYSAFVPIISADVRVGCDSLASELSDFAARGGIRSVLEAPCIVNEIVAHLTRSSGWTTPLLTLAMQLRYEGAHDDVLQEIRKFLADGFAFLQAGMTVLSPSSIYFRARQLEPSIKAAWDSVLEAVGKLERYAQVLAQEPPTDWLSVVADNLSLVEEAGRKLLNGLEILRTRPIDAISEAADLAAGTSRFEIHPISLFDANNVIIARQDLVEVVTHILENSRRELAELNKPISVEVRFRSIGATRLAVEFSQDAPWRTPQHLEGGLVRLREILTWYGGTSSVDEEDKEGRLKTTLTLWRWRER